MRISLMGRLRLEVAGAGDRRVRPRSLRPGVVRLPGRRARSSDPQARAGRGALGRGSPRHLGVGAAQRRLPGAAVAAGAGVPSEAVVAAFELLPAPLPSDPWSTSRPQPSTWRPPPPSPTRWPLPRRQLTLRESAHLRLMAAHAAAGNRGEALRAYEQCRALLDEELCVNPSAANETAYAAPLGEEPEAPAATSGPPTSLPVDMTSFVGRTQELAEVRSCSAGTARLPHRARRGRQDPLAVSPCGWLATSSAPSPGRSDWPRSWPPSGAR